MTYPEPDLETRQMQKDQLFQPALKVRVENQSPGNARYAIHPSHTLSHLTDADVERYTTENAPIISRTARNATAR